MCHYQGGCRCEACSTKERNRRQRNRNKLRDSFLSGEDLFGYPNQRLTNMRNNCKRAGLEEPDITVEEVSAALQVDACESCGLELFDLTDRILDHCHVTNRLRGTLCTGCNIAEGHLKTLDNLDGLREYMVRTDRALNDDLWPEDLFGEH